MSSSSETAEKVDFADRDPVDVETVMASAGIEESAHGLRHTVAMRLAREHGRDLALVVDILGHADLKSTRR